MDCIAAIACDRAAAADGVSVAVEETPTEEGVFGGLRWVVSTEEATPTVPGLVQLLKGEACRRWSTREGAGLGGR